MICKCGHKDDEHRYWGPSNCWVKDKKGRLICPCIRFKLDNLKYLEQQYEESTK